MLRRGSENTGNIHGLLLLDRGGHAHRPRLLGKCNILYYSRVMNNSIILVLRAQGPALCRCASTTTKYFRVTTFTYI